MLVFVQGLDLDNCLRMATHFLPEEKGAPGGRGIDWFSKVINSRFGPIGLPRLEGGLEALRRED